MWEEEVPKFAPNFQNMLQCMVDLGAPIESFLKDGSIPWFDLSLSDFTDDSNVHGHF